MSDLSPRARSLVENAREQRRTPPPEARQRLERSVAALALTSAAAGLVAPAVAVWKIALVAVVAASAIGGTVIALHQPSPTPSTSIVEPKPAPPPDPEKVVDPPPPNDLPAVVETPPPPPIPLPRAVPRTGTAPPPPAPESQAPPEEERSPSEATLLRSAMRDVDGQRWQAALDALEAHHTEFPRSALRGEAAALRVLALCGLNRIDEARSVAASIPAGPIVEQRLVGSCVDP